MTMTPVTIDAQTQLIVALRLALDALNMAPRFRVRHTDSYRIASAIKAALSQAEANPYAS
jgi:hypothetical protein